MEQFSWFDGKEARIQRSGGMINSTTVVSMATSLVMVTVMSRLLVDHSVKTLSTGDCLTAREEPSLLVTNGT